ncbi:hypothetical protein EGW08_017729 [Elysia chlorotica]|uniref:Sulfotransferase domain-containing protein n=1 Tax=Elysia chlorotica TaxID=188477 RepID=A0A433SYW4_ELYCH|nr:hypothetical protein EGW08_017729 [Elysia chlorotica]
MFYPRTTAYQPYPVGEKGTTGAKGTHWMFEAISMILSGNSQYSQVGKGISYLEFASPELYQDLPSPRVLNTHNRFDWLPTGVRTHKNKIIVTTRNPKDVAVSLYHHHINLSEMYDYSGDFQDWIPLFLEGKSVDCGDYCEYHLDWDRVVRENPDWPILVVKFEDCVKDLADSIRKISVFLERPLSENQIADMAKALSFTNMKSHFRNTLTEKLIRKGEVADWKNWLTEAQSAQIDRQCQQLKGSQFEPKFEM